MSPQKVCLRILEGDSISEKLRPTDPQAVDWQTPRNAIRVAAPVRSRELRMVPAKKCKVPPPCGMSDPNQRVRILHALANHELQAVELFAWALLAFPETPAAFQRGLLGILQEEQDHCQQYIGRLEALGSHFGAFPVTGHFWKQLDPIQTPFEFLVFMGLTLENANLDFSDNYANKAEACGDHQTANVLRAVHRDEVRHVAFSWRWFQKWKPQDATDWSAFADHLHPPLSPGRAKGNPYLPEARRKAGLSDEFIEQLANTTAKRPSGQKR